MDTAFLNIENSEVLFENQKVGFVLDEENEPWFLATDVIKVLAFRRPDEVMANYIFPNFKRTLRDFPTAAAEQGRLDDATIFVNELGVYSLVDLSGLPQARRYQQHIYHAIKMIRRMEVTSLNESYVTMIDTLNQRLQLSEQQLLAARRNPPPRITTSSIKKVKAAHSPNFGKGSQYCFVLLKLNEPCEYQYYVIRTKIRSLNRKLSEVHIRHPNIEKILHYTHQDSNTKDLYCRMREQLTGKLMFFRNYIRIRDQNLTEQDLIGKINELNNSLLAAAS